MKRSLEIKGGHVWGNNWRIITNMSEDDVNAYNKATGQKNHRHYLITLLYGGYSNRKVKWEELSDQELEDINVIIKEHVLKG